jgi:protein subunit release factor B
LATMGASESIHSRLRALGVQESDVEERFIRGSGPGGQKINKTSPTVWLRHGPTGIEVRCQAERSQAANRERAWLEMCERLESRKRGESAAERQVLEKARRRGRQKNRGQKVAMILTKKHRAKHKTNRGRVGEE